MARRFNVALEIETSRVYGRRILEGVTSFLRSEVKIAPLGIAARQSSDILVIDDACLAIAL